MSSTVLFLVGIAYLVGAVDQYWKGDNGHAIMFFGYFLANCGLMISVK